MKPRRRPLVNTMFGKRKLGRFERGFEVSGIDGDFKTNATPRTRDRRVDLTVVGVRADTRDASTVGRHDAIIVLWHEWSVAQRAQRFLFLFWHRYLRHLVHTGSAHTLFTLVTNLINSAAYSFKLGAVTM